MHAIWNLRGEKVLNAIVICRSATLTVQLLVLIDVVLGSSNSAWEKGVVEGLPTVMMSNIRQKVRSLGSEFII